MTLKKGAYKEAIIEAILEKENEQFTAKEISQKLPEIAYKTIISTMSILVKKGEVIKIRRGGGFNTPAIYSISSSLKPMEPENKAAKTSEKQDLPTKVWTIIVNKFENKHFIAKDIQDELATDYPDDEISANHVSKTLSNMAYNKKGIKRLQRGGHGVPAVYAMDHDAIARQAKKEKKPVVTRSRPVIVKKIRPTGPKQMQMTKAQLADAVHELFTGYNTKISDLQTQVNELEKTNEQLRGSLKLKDANHARQISEKAERIDELRDKIVLLKRQLENQQHAEENTQITLPQPVAQ